MKKLLATCLLLLLYHVGISQVYGDLFMDKRKIEKNIDYTISYSKPGKLVFDIAVNSEGKVTSCVLNTSKSTITSTTAMMKAKNKIMQELKFERGYTFPEFHRGSVQIETVQTGEVQDTKFAPPPY